MRLTWPLTGRSEEARLIQAAVLDADSAGIVVSGATGVGKSRIVRDTLMTFANQGWEVRWVVGSSAVQKLPLGALTTWAHSTSDDSLMLIHGVVAALTASARGLPVLIGIDDAPLLDDLSIVVIHQIVVQRLAKVVLTVRGGEPIPAATGDLWRTDDFDRLDMRPLPRSAAEAMITEALGGRLHRDAEERLWTLAQGNPLYLRNIVEQEVADARLAVRDGLWTWHGDATLPPGLVELVEARIGRLPDRVSDVVDLLAVGEPVSLEVLARISGPDAVEDADRRGLICLEPAHGAIEVRLAHPLYGEVRRSRAPTTTLRRLRGLVAAGLAACDDADDIHVVVRRASLSLDSDLDPDVGVLIRAARGAAWLVDLQLADRLAAAAIRAGGGAEANLIRAFVLSWQGRGLEADSVLADVDSSELDAVRRAQTTFLRAVNLLFTLADPAAALTLVNDAAEDEAPGQDSMNAFRCVYWAAMGRPEAALQYARKFDPDALPDHLQMRLSAWAVTVAHGETGSTSRAVASAKAGYPIPVRAFVVIADAHANALTLAGRISAAEDVAAMMRHRAMSAQGATFGQIAVAVTGQVALAAGHLDSACSLLASAIDLVTGWNSTAGFRYRYQILLTTALAMRGMTQQAKQACAAIDACWHPGWRSLDYARAIASAWVLATQGLLSDAIATVRSAAESSRQTSQYAAEVMCLQTATQLGDSSTAARLGELVGTVEGPRAGLAAGLAEALHTADADQLESLSERFESMGDLVAAVDAASHAAACFRAGGLRGSALRCSTRAETLAQAGGGISTPAYRRAAERLPLTGREREIVMLLGTAMSNRDIAATLSLSVRTVESHIYKAMAKTGTASREELAALLSPAPAQPS
ncbi:LuxR C-terminal-related transcriptional regulator [Mycobacterium sp. Y57]|uniref:LuxR C-terminal-related transcriptional regulator n=1 Tax=Mycolicibacterium xanthum TaxID=2796469 RepID=UPI001C85672B|nr:LuxR family transcriptional regulator [Mycolicibacterium xanthum]MBX7434806.1 LuxR C-terminal-related transcriptional regulator [Mycolicibacterium xanthum]